MKEGLNDHTSAEHRVRPESLAGHKARAGVNPNQNVGMLVQTKGGINKKIRYLKWRF